MKRHRQFVLLATAALSVLALIALLAHLRTLKPLHAIFPDGTLAEYLSGTTVTLAKTFPQLREIDIDGEVFLTVPRPCENSRHADQ